MPANVLGRNTGNGNGKEGSKANSGGQLLWKGQKQACNRRFEN